MFDEHASQGSCDDPPHEQIPPTTHSLAVTRSDLMASSTGQFQKQVNKGCREGKTQTNCSASRPEPGTPDWPPMSHELIAARMSIRGAGSGDAIDPGRYLA
jgi:hypothetical protein